MQLLLYSEYRVPAAIRYAELTKATRRTHWGLGLHIYVHLNVQERAFSKKGLLGFLCESGSLDTTDPSSVDLFQISSYRRPRLPMRRYGTNTTEKDSRVRASGLDSATRKILNLTGDKAKFVQAQS